MRASRKENAILGLGSGGSDVKVETEDGRLIWGKSSKENSNCNERPTAKKTPIIK